MKRSWSHLPMVVTRSHIKKEDTWDLSPLFESLDHWQEAFTTFYDETGSPAWSHLSQYRGRLGESGDILKIALETCLKMSREVEKFYVFAHLKHDEDITEDKNKTAYDKALTLYHEFAQAAAWLEPEILGLPDHMLAQYLKAPQLEAYRFHLEKIVRLKKHTLPPDQEALLAMAGKSLSTASRAFSAISDADFSFGIAETSSGEEKEITQSTYMLYIRDHDRTLRESAFKKMHGVYKSYENTMCELLNGCVEGHLFQSRARHYPSCLEAALYPKNVDTAVYRALIAAVRQNLDVLHRYVSLRKRMLGLSSLHLWDLYVPLTSDVDIRLDYGEAAELIVESVAPLGEDYQSQLEKGLKEERWVDKFENKNKRSGGYSSGCYDSKPYILMNYKGVLRDVMTLAHEAGHSMHSFLSRRHQPYHYSQYPIFLAEVASTFNEDLLSRLLIDRFPSRKEKIYLINEKIEDIRATLFRQTMFAEFELLIHDMADRKEPLTPARLNEEYLALNRAYFGEAIHLDEEIASEWARIPHFYYNFYVYQYATGISAALSLVEKVVQGGAKERDDYLAFLQGGCSLYPLDLLDTAGIDMRKPDPVNDAIQKFRGLVDELEMLLSEEELVPTN